MTSIYVASKAKHGAFWRRLRERGYPICSSWIDESEPGQTTDWPGLWSRVVSEVSESDCLIHLLFPGETPKGALVEVGVALARGVPVYWVGREYQCCAHPLVTMCKTLNEAFNLCSGR